MAVVVTPAGETIQVELVRDADKRVSALTLTAKDGTVRQVSFAGLPAPDLPGDRVSVQEKLQALADQWLGAGEVRVKVYSLEPPFVRVYGGGT